MPELSHSNRALNIKHRFLRSDVILYVEGKDDVVFWSIVTGAQSKIKISVEALGSCDKVDEKIVDISRGRLRALAARDLDYLRAKNRICESPLVLYTAGYSIENSLITPESLANIVADLARQASSDVVHAVDWLIEFTNCLLPLVRVDLASQISTSPACVLGENCTRFMNSEASYLANHTKVQRFIESLPAIERRHLGTAQEYLDATTLPLALRGHFLASAALKYVTGRAKELGDSGKLSVSHDSLFGLLMACWRASYRTDHPHRDHYRKSLSRASSALAA